MRIPFNYDLYLTGKYRAVHRDSANEIDNIEALPDNDSFYKFNTKSKSTLPSTWSISDTGRIFKYKESEQDVFLEPVPQPFHLPEALKGANLITRDGRDVRDFKPNPDQASPKAYIAMVGDDLMYYHPSGCVNRSCEPHPLDLFIKIN